MRRQQKRLLTGIVVIFVASALVVWIAWSRKSAVPAQQSTPTGDATTQERAGVREITKRPGDDTQDASQEQPSTLPGIGAREVREAYDRGMGLHRAGKLIEARTELSKALFSDRLAGEAEDQAVKVLTELAEKTILSRGYYEGDPYVVPYTFRPGEVLQRVERKLKLHVPAQGILMVNRIGRAEDIQAGQTLKMIKGPFHAVITKHDFTMDIYLQRDDLPKVFIRRMKVGLGANGSTPTGNWRIKLGEKLVRATYYPTPNSLNRDGGPVLYGKPGYPFGRKGLWIKLEGTDPKTRTMTNYGIHSTDEPDSIGKESSEGCIRLADTDIDLVWSLLYEHWSTVRTCP